MAMSDRPIAYLVGSESRRGMGRVNYSLLLAQQWGRVLEAEEVDDE